MGSIKTAKKAARIANSAKKYSRVKSGVRKVAGGYTQYAGHRVVNKYTSNKHMSRYRH